VKDDRSTRGTQRSVGRPVLILAAVAGLVIAVCVSFVLVTEHNLASKLANVRKPAAIDAYERLYAELSADWSFFTEESADDPGQQRTSPFQGFPEDATEIMEAYDQLLFTTMKPLQASDVPWRDVPQRWHDWSDETRQQVAELLAEHQEVVREIRETAERGGPVYPLDFSKGLAMDLPHLAPMRECARLLRADAIIKAMEGNKSEAFEDIIAGMKLGEALAQEPVLISQLVRIAMNGILSSGLQASLDGGDLSPEQTRRLMMQIARARDRRAFADSLAGELHVGLQIFSGLRAGDPAKLNALNQAMGVGSQDTMDKLFRDFYRSPFGRPWLNMDAATYADIIGRACSAAEQPYYEAAPELNQIEMDFANLPLTRVLSNRLTPGLMRACEAQARHEAILDLMQIGILVEQHHARTGSYPETLDAIVPELGGSLPVDPFTGKPYQYQPSDDGFLLYSIGQNLIDDGGTHEFRSGDIVWRGEE
jgi:hypothetical protein